MIPPKLTPISQSVYKKIDQPDFDVIISCGRKSVIPSIHLKNNSKQKVINIHVQDPKVNFNHFDFIVAPEHDSINCLLYTSPSPRDATLSRMPSSA